MDLTSIVIMLCIGNTAGWLAGIYWEGGRYGLLGDVAGATVGSLVAGILFRAILPALGTEGTIVASTIGSAIVLALLRRASTHR
jgi:uncharacterized membrane protein YeaQ/YmgE (transglycosylase-associated protein family)